jgi:hypothetical protein
MMSDSRQLSAVMTATLSAELESRLPADLVADLVYRTDQAEALLQALVVQGSCSACGSSHLRCR